MQYRALSPGDSLPQTVFKSADGSDFSTLRLGGSYLLLCFAAPDMFCRAPELDSALRRGLSAYPPSHARLIKVHPEAPRLLATPDGPPIRDLFDPGLTAYQKFGAAPRDASDPAHIRALCMLFDPMQRLIATTPIREVRDIQAVLAVLDAQPPVERFSGRIHQAPVLYLPRVFSPELCAELIQRYHAESRDLTGVMRNLGGKTVAVHDPSFKRRRDCLIDDSQLISLIQSRILNAVLPELRKCYSFEATRMERYLVGCYSANDDGYFAPHRDNTTPATAHRRFAVSINLNDDFDGGAVSFPEFGPQGIRAETGAAVVFGCGLLHAVGRVTRGARYAFLPFVYDEAAARIRQANLDSVGHAQ